MSDTIWLRKDDDDHETFVKRVDAFFERYRPALVVLSHLDTDDPCCNDEPRYRSRAPWVAEGGERISEQIAKNFVAADCREEQEQV